ncbi:MAG: hypothetical protein HY901_31665, partial [Deltaproteobacteria bacterium]|nr:hypothetical protein [Deltaproteobacteria bacterium]
SAYPAPATVNKLAVDDKVLWIATDDGVVRFDSGSRRATRRTMDDGLPSQSVTAVAFDEHNVWFATRGGLAYYDPDVDGLRAFTPADGLAGEDFLELYQLGDDVWVRTDLGLSRIRPKTRVISNFTFKDIGGEQIRTFVLDGDTVWLGTENGLINFVSSTDAFVPFPQQAALEGRSIFGVETFTDYLFIATDKELAQYNKLNRSFKRFSAADGLARNLGATGSLLSGGLYTVMFADGAEVLDIQRELWASRTKEATEQADKAGGWRLFGNLNAEEPIDFTVRGPLVCRASDGPECQQKLAKEHYNTAIAGFGAGYRFSGNRSLDASARLDYGQLDASGIRDLQYRLEYLGATDDVVREVRVEDKLKYRTVEEGLERPILLQGGHARLASKGEEPAISAQVTGGVRRGASQRDFIAGVPRQEIYALSQRYILPGSERVWIDGEQLTNGTDYTIIYPAGQLAFLDPERVDDLSVIEVEYEYDLMSKKGLGVLSLLDLLPGDREVGDWSRTGEARLISEESGLYAQIDGAAPKYIDRGWTRSVYAEFRQGSRTIQVAIHDMGTEANAQSLYTYDLPPAREPVGERDNLVLDVGLATSYAAKAFAETYYIELSIDEKSDPAKQSLKLFASQILDRGTNSGASAAEAPLEWMAAARVSSSPFKGSELGARVIETQGLGDPKNPVGGKPLRRLTTGIADARYEREVGQGGRLTSYAELAGTHEDKTGADGWGALGKLRFSHPSLDGTLSYRHHSDGYTPIGTDATMVGKLNDEVRFSATGYPARWLPATGLFLRQMAHDEEGRAGVVQQAMARVQLNKDGLPALSLQGGHTLLENPEATTRRFKAVGQAEYDLAQWPLNLLRFKHFSIRALYGFSQGETDELGSFAHGDRVQLTRVETKIAPTATEQAYALFRSRNVGLQSTEGGEFDLRAWHWELNSGARSAIVPGLIPQANYTVLYDDDRTGQDPVRSSKGSFSGALGIYPGQWLGLLAPMALEPRYSIANDEKAEGEIKTTHTRAHRIDNRAVWAGTRLELEFYQLWEIAQADEDQHPFSGKLELRNRLLFRPVFSSPITLRVNYIGQKKLNDRILAPSAPAWGNAATWEYFLEWLMRWNKTLTTKVTGNYSWGRVRDVVFVDTTQGSINLQDYLQERVSGTLELRLFPLADASRMFLLQRDQVYRLFGKGGSSIEAWGFEAALGAIWTLRENLYLDLEANYQRMFCLDQPCAEVNKLTPRILLTFNL